MSGGPARARAARGRDRWARGSLRSEIWPGGCGRDPGGTASPGQRFQNTRDLFPVLLSKGNRCCALAAVLDKNNPDRFSRFPRLNSHRGIDRKGSCLAASFFSLPVFLFLLTHLFGKGIVFEVAGEGSENLKKKILWVLSHVENEVVR